MLDIDPKITVEYALAFAGTQVALANMLFISKPSVNEWVSSQRKYLPPLQAYRLRELHPSVFGDSEAAA